MCALDFTKLYHTTHPLPYSTLPYYTMRQYNVCYDVSKLFLVLYDILLYHANLLLCHTIHFLHLRSQNEHIERCKPMLVGQTYDMAPTKTLNPTYPHSGSLI